MEIRLLSETEDQLIFSTEPSVGVLSTLPDSSLFSVSGDFGKLLLQQLPAGRFNIFYSQYHIKRDCRFYLATGEPSLELHFMEFNEIAFHLSGLGEVNAGEREYNITYLPYVESVTALKAGHFYSSFDIHFPLRFLIDLAAFHPLVDAFLRQADQQKAYQYSSERHRASFEMLEIIRRIQINEFSPPALYTYLDAKAVELLMLALHSLSVQVDGRIKFRKDDIEKMHEAEKIIMANLENPLSLIGLARKVGVNDFKLKKLFPQVYGMTVFNYLMEAKMARARNLVLYTELAFSEIALQTGFKNIPNFNTAFKRKFNCNPTFMRKHKNNP